jgi:Domain of unknown function DUF11
MGPNKKLAWTAIARRVRGLRYGLALLALAAGAGVALIVGASAFGDTVCGTTGDVSDCAQWGVLGNATRLVVQNTGTQRISSFTFTLPPGTMVSGVAGVPSGTCSWAANMVTCTMPIDPGQTFFGDILYSGQPPAVGSTATLTPTDAGGAAQPGQSVLLQSSSVCGVGTSTTTCTLSSSSSSTMSSTNTMTQACQADLKVTKLLAASNAVIKHHRDLYVTFANAEFLEYEIFVQNRSNCPATDVVITDALPSDFNCHGGVWHYAGQTPVPNHFHCKGEGRDVRVTIGTLGADQTAIVELRGKFPRERTTTNTARATATNAAGQHSDHVHVEVVSKKQFEADKGKFNTP